MTRSKLRGAARRTLAACLPVAVLAVVVAAAVPSAGRWPPWRRDDDAPPPVYPEVTATSDWLAGRLGARGLAVVDARPEAAYLAGHIPGAISLAPDPEVDPPEAPLLLGGSGLTGRGVIVCYGDSSFAPDAASLFWLLDAAGAERPMLLEGGIAAWVAAGGELESNPATLPPATWTGSARPERVASAAYVALKFGVLGYEIIDARGWDAWEGPIDESQWTDPPRVGHVPHALPYDFREFLGQGGAFQSPEDTRGIFSRAGPRPSSPVNLQDEFIVHGDGAFGDGAVGYFLLRRAGLERVRYFPDGWASWAEDPSLPVVRIVGAEELKRRIARARKWFRPDAPPAGFALFDVRHSGNHASGHLPGAVSLNSRFFADSLDVYVERHWLELDRSTAPLITYCYGPNCIRSRNCSTEAARQGFVNVERFYGGIEDWRLAGGELHSSPLPVKEEGE